MTQRNICDQREVGVVIRCHNQGKYLAGCVASVDEQGPTVAEIVVIDDGSQDETAAHVSHLRAGPRLILLQNAAPVGPAAALNQGIEATSTPLLLPLDADDELASGFVAGAIAALDASGADFAYPSVELVGARAGVRPAEAFDAARLRRRNYVPVSTLFPRSLFDELGGFSSALDDLGYEDWEFWLRAVGRGARGVAAPDIRLRYRQHEQSRNTRNRRQAARAHLAIRRMHPSQVSWFDVLAPRVENQWRRVRRT